VQPLLDYLVSLRFLCQVYYNFCRDVRSASFRVCEKHNTLLAALGELCERGFLSVVRLDFATEAFEVDFVALLGWRRGCLCFGFSRGIFCSVLDSSIVSHCRLLFSYGLCSGCIFFLRFALRRGLFLRRRSGSRGSRAFAQLNHVWGKHSMDRLLRTRES
jgi:hypothetical protein